MDVLSAERTLIGRGYIIRRRSCERGIHPGPLSRAVAELLELFLPVTRGDLHLNKPGVSPGSDDGGDGPSVVTSKRKAGSICRGIELTAVLLSCLSRSRPPLLPSTVYFCTASTRRPLSLNLRSHAQMTRTRLAPYAFLLSYYSP